MILSCLATFRGWCVPFGWLLLVSVELGVRTMHGGGVTDECVLQIVKVLRLLLCIYVPGIIVVVCECQMTLYSAACLCFVRILVGGYMVVVVC